jgi:hypothetical protein
MKKCRHQTAEPRDGLQHQITRTPQKAEIPEHRKCLRFSTGVDGID